MVNPDQSALGEETTDNGLPEMPLIDWLLIGITAVILVGVLFYGIPHLS